MSRRKSYVPTADAYAGGVIEAPYRENPTAIRLPLQGPAVSGAGRIDWDFTRITSPPEASVRIVAKFISAARTVSRRIPDCYEMTLPDDNSRTQNEAELRRFLTEIFTIFYQAPRNWHGFIMRMEVAHRLGDLWLEDKPHQLRVPNRRTRQQDMTQILEPFRDAVMDRLVAMVQQKPNVCSFCPRGAN